MDNSKTIQKENYVSELLRYLSFWPYFLISFFLFIFLAYSFLRYADYQYSTTATIEILDKAQDSEMALPTAMTVFNRSMINLDNEISVLGSYKLHKRVCEKLNSNLKYYTIGTVKTSENHSSEWLGNFNLKFKEGFSLYEVINESSFEINFVNEKMEVNYYDSDNNYQVYYFDSYTTRNQPNDLPFELEVFDDISKISGQKKILKILNFDSIVKFFSSNVFAVPVSNESDQLNLKIQYSNRLIAKEYINMLINEFNNDGIIDRQLEYKNTIEFVNSRSIFLESELKKIEQAKQEFKERNNLTNIVADASMNAQKQIEYNSELFKTKTQLDLTIILEDIIKSSVDLGLLPVNIGFEESNINILISEFNRTFKDLERTQLTAGSNNIIVKNLKIQLQDLRQNILFSIDGHKNLLNSKIENIEMKESEFADVYSSIPENEKILRSIERELEIKEALYLLLLQKREEAAINFAVIKPSIKVIDGAISSDLPITPKNSQVYALALLLSFFIPYSIIFIFFYFDNKIHTKSQLSKLIQNIPVIAEIPYTKVNSELVNSSSRDPLSESIRMLSANLKYTLFKKDDSSCKVILVTSSIKGEGKTLVSTNLSSLLSSKAKVLLLGSDLRNPQIHKLINVSKNLPGLSNYIFKDDIKWKDLLLNYNNLDIMLSGAIPPNPTDLLVSEKFENLIEEVKKEYDYVIIDSAPCLLVSDTIEISRYSDSTVYVLRSNYSTKNLISFINELKEKGSLVNMNLALNAVGNSGKYGYKYGYQYGYQYGYKYGYKYNYGYGYGYASDLEKN